MCNKKRTLRCCSGNTHGIRNEGYLPREIWVDILTRLPAKMVGQCKCICKHWRALIEEPSFVELHHFRSESRPGGCYLLISSCTRNKKDTIFFSTDYEGGLAQHSFSYSVSGSKRGSGEMELSHSECEIFTLGSLSWRKIDIVPPASHFEFGGDGICLGGVLPWRNFSLESFRTVHDEVLVTFDVKDERFGLISLPGDPPACLVCLNLEAIWLLVRKSQKMKWRSFGY
ncbi:hypothetical protein RHSIM_Rhsim03G0072200 [Rhododendron simsii]|uniref:F-box domain-containing protein n=1 Tax=Rhododendron simsii TaxID=118357 RepID=A0A834H7Q3_RHOSS|nr:hypothetical protein RHSIM_Rhsim03G0072200 [Rhododendron simsii]